MARDEDFAESVFKGRIGEALVERLFDGSGFRVQRFGFEVLSGEVGRSCRIFKSQEEEKQWYCPDFLVSKGKPEYVEVKFRASGGLHKNDPREFDRMLRHWPMSHIIRVTCIPGHEFQVISPPYKPNPFTNPFRSRPRFLTLSPETPPFFFQPAVYQRCIELIDAFVRPGISLRGNQPPSH